MRNLAVTEYWFITGSQHLYGEKTLRQVAEHSRVIVDGLNASGLPSKLILQPVLTGPEAIRDLLERASGDARCAGVIAWMHTFSPAKMWIGGLRRLTKPLLHLHTQFNRELPWSSIDMDFMNLNQSAHGDREFGHLITRLRHPREVVVGHWQNPAVVSQIESWIRVADAWHDWQGARFARFGDNMRSVAVTEGDKVAAEIRFGFSVDGYGIGDLVQRVNAVSETEIDRLVEEYTDLYTITPSLQRNGPQHASLRDAARQELGIRAFLQEGNFKGFTTTFEDLHGLKQLPGLAAQRLMAEGYGFGAEGDWKSAALLRAIKVIAGGKQTSFMEDYTYDLPLGDELVLGSHMLEICPSIARDRPALSIHPLGIGGREDPPRLVFDASTGPATNATLIDLGTRFRLLVNEVDVIPPQKPLPRLPVARATWKCRPEFSTACEAWIHAGGSHHTILSQAVNRRQLASFADIAGIEAVFIDAQTSIAAFRQELRTNEIYYHLASGFGAN